MRHYSGFFLALLYSFSLPHMLKGWKGGSAMKVQSMKRQALITAMGSALVRGMGFVMRLTVSRMLGPEAMGIMELSSSAHMLLVTPAASGLPGAVSRLSARAKEEERPSILAAGRQLAGMMSGLMIPVFLLFSPWIARLLGDVRTLPSLWLMAPSVLFIGLSSVYDGYFYGCGNAWAPMLSELGEQVIRLLTVLVLFLLPALSLPWRAAVPALSTTMGEGMGLMVVMLMAGGAAKAVQRPGLSMLRRRLFRLSLPLMLSRLSHTGLRALCGVIIPLRLMAAGLMQSEAVSRMGMMNGMVMPLMFLPGLVTGALATVGGPAMAKCKRKGQQRRLILRLLLPGAAWGAACSGILYLAAPLIALKFYRLPELAGLIRALCPMAALLSIQQVAGGMMTGLGLQKKALGASLLGAAATLLCTWLWTARPGLHIYGAGYAAMAGHGLGLTATLIYLISHTWGRDAAGNDCTQYSQSKAAS